MNQIETTICYLNDLLRENSCLKTGKIFGKTELMEKDTRTFPVIVEAGVTKDCIPSDVNMPLIYWRVNDVKFNEDAEGFGVTQNIFTSSVTLFFYASTRVLKKCNAEQLDWAGVIANILPRGLFQPSTDIHSCSLGELSIDTDKAGILSSELAGNAIDGRILDLIAFSFTTELTGAICGPVC